MAIVVVVVVVVVIVVVVNIVAVAALPLCRRRDTKLVDTGFVRELEKAIIK